MIEVHELSDKRKLELVTKAFLGHLMEDHKMTRDAALGMIAEMVAEFELYDLMFGSLVVQ